jgi:hypothetical protein
LSFFKLLFFRFFEKYGELLYSLSVGVILWLSFLRASWYMYLKKYFREWVETPQYNGRSLTHNSNMNFDRIMALYELRNSTFSYR